MITPDEGAYAFEILLRHTRCYAGYAPIDGIAMAAALAAAQPHSLKCSVPPARRAARP